MLLCETKPSFADVAELAPVSLEASAAGAGVKSMLRKDPRRAEVWQESGYLGGDSAAAGWSVRVAAL